MQAVFDTGASRNFIDGDMLDKLRKSDAAKGAIVDIFDVESLECRTVDRETKVVMNRGAHINVTFAESTSVSQTCKMEFGVIDGKGSSESLIIEKPNAGCFWVCLYKVIY